MHDLVLEPTSTAQWQSLISEAEDHAHCQLDETLESHLVFMLMRFTSKPEVASSVISLDFLDSLNQTGQQQAEGLRDVGDKCLLFSGLFPHYAKRRLVRVSYFVNIGRSAYHHLHHTTRTRMAELYGQLAEGFVPMMDVLHAVRDLAGSSHAPDLLTSFELWEEAGSRNSLRRLKIASPNALPITPVADTNPDKGTRH